MIISKRHKFVYFAISKTGSRTLYSVLIKDFGGKMQVDHGRRVPGGCKDYFKFATIRNPYDRICSAYQTCFPPNDQYRYRALFKDLGLKNTLYNFLKVIEDNQPGANRATTFPQTYWINGNNIDMYLRTENLQEDFQKLPFVKEQVILPIINARLYKNNPVPPAEKVLNTHSIKIINRLYNKDFEVLGFKKIHTVKEFIETYKNE